ncbi:MAG: A24 family peptidase C-terminal domain-containing protein [Archaeoglobaceae archaeon]
MNLLELIKVLLVLFFLLYACVLDIRSRIVPNRVWKFMLLVNLPITAFQILQTAVERPLSLFIAILGIAFVVVLSYLLYSLSLYGGADAKALMCIGIIFPLYPEIGFFPILNHGFGIFAFSVLANSVILAPFLVIGIFVRNLFKEGFKGFLRTPLYYLAGYRVPVEKIRFHNLFEFIDEKGVLRRVKKAVEPSEEMITRLRSAGLCRVWCTPALPFLIFITFGYLSAIFLGDLIFAFISALL